MSAADFPLHSVHVSVAKLRLDEVEKGIGLRLVHAERYDDIRDAIVREKAMKKWKRQWKLKLIRRINPDWRDLYDDIQSSNM